MSDKTAFINFLTTSLNNDGYLVADKLEGLYKELKTLMNKNKLVLKSTVDDDLLYLKFCYLIFKNKGVYVTN
jgi:hypothetical protein